MALWKQSISEPASLSSAKMAVLSLRARARDGEGRRGRGRARARPPGGCAPARGRAAGGHARGGGGLSRVRCCNLGAGRVREDGGPGELRPGNPGSQRIAGVATASRSTRAPGKGREAEHPGTLKGGRSEQGWRRDRAAAAGDYLCSETVLPEGCLFVPWVFRASLVIPWGSFLSSSKHLGGSGHWSPL